MSSRSLKLLFFGLRNSKSKLDTSRRRISRSSLQQCRALSTASFSYSPSDPSASSSTSAMASAGKFASSRDRQSSTTEADSARWATSYLRETFPSLPGEFPPGVAKRIMTHMSYRAGAQTYGHNARLSFLGRRVLKAYLLMYLQSSVPEEVMLGPGAGRPSAALGAPRDAGTIDGFVDFDDFIESALDTRELGERVATAWKLENGVRWTSAIPPTPQFSSASAEHSYRKGKAKVMGTAVEAIIGGIFHQFGGLATYSLFHTYVLPHLNVPTSFLSSSPVSTSTSEPGSATSNGILLVDGHYTPLPQKRRAAA